MRRSRPGLFHSVFALVLTVAACDADLGELGEDTDGSSNDGGSNGEGGGFEPCSDENPCPDGQFCFNGLCAVGCTSNNDCADDQYCDTTSLLCQNSEVPSCDGEGGCFGDQVCFEGLCSTPEDTTCVSGASPDGCESDAVCLDDGDTSVCYTMPACGEDGSCPTGLTGAVCNDGFLPDKDRICLLGACETEAHCPSSWSCIAPSTAVLGVCSDGAIGMPCIEGSDCTSGLCTNPLGTVGFCG